MHIRSSLGDYRVDFTDDAASMLGEDITGREVVIGDRRVLGAHATRLAPLLDRVRVLEIDASEAQKSYEGLTPILDDLIRGGFRRGDRLIALGGGITQDITAFIASILYRGVEWVFLPTTLLAQADSCIGSKTSINFAEFKNQLGGFYPPRRIVIDAGFLTTLPRPEILSGLGEMAHYFPIDGEEAFGRYAAGLPSALADGASIPALIRESLKIKKGYVEIDEFDRKERQVFNYGHSFGHAIESVTNYAVPHGIAVSYGIDLANLVSVRFGFLDSEVRGTIRAALEQIWREFPLPKIDRAGFREALGRDKKNRGSELGLILTRGWDGMFKHYCPLNDELSGWIDDFFDEVDG